MGGLARQGLHQPLLAIAFQLSPHVMGAVTAVHEILDRLRRHGRQVDRSQPAHLQERRPHQNQECHRGADGIAR